MLTKAVRPFVLVGAQSVEVHSDYAGVCVLDGCTHYMPEACPYRWVEFLPVLVWVPPLSFAELSRCAHIHLLNVKILNKGTVSLFNILTFGRWVGDAEKALDMGDIQRFSSA